MKDFVVGDTIWISNMPIWNNKKIIGYESFLAIIIKEWYDCNHKHCFILQKGDGSTIRRQGKNLYSYGKLVEEGKNHFKLAENKHYRKELGYK